MIYPFAVNIETPGDLIQIVEQLLCPKSRDPRDTNNRAITINLGDNEVDDVQMESLNVALVSEDGEESPPLALPNSSELSPDVTVAHMQNIMLEDKESRVNIDSSKDKYDD